MDRRILLPLLFAALSCGCATLDEGPAPVAASKVTPVQAYDAGLLFHVRGDDESARRAWRSCLESSEASSPVRLDCLVALERLAPSRRDRAE